MCALCAGDTLGPADPRPGGQGGRVRELAAARRTGLTEVECLDVCESDVVVVRPSPVCRRTGARPLWLSRLAGDEATEALDDYVAGGGPGAVAVPPGLTAYVVPSPAES
jgi:hypothetical protein|nr:hypothetical protein [Ornithinimicrobium sediminis]